MQTARTEDGLQSYYFFAGGTLAGDAAPLAGTAGGGAAATTMGVGLGIGFPAFFMAA